MTVINITRSLRVANEAGISGAEAPDVEGVITLDQVISSATEEETAMSGFKDHQMQNISLVSDQDVEAQFLGVRYPITASVAGPPGTITTAGDDLTGIIATRDLVRIEGSAGDDGVYLVVSVGAAPNLITLENGQDLPSGGGDGTVARVASRQIISYQYPVLAIVLATGAITITGDVTDKFAAGDALNLTGTAANDGYWVIDSVTEAAGVTTLIVNGGTLVANAGVAGVFALVRPAFILAANVPFLWSLDGGMPNPFIGPISIESPEYDAFRGDVAHCMINNAGATNANFDGRIGTNAIIF